MIFNHNMSYGSSAKKNTCSFLNIDLLSEDFIKLFWDFSTNNLFYFLFQDESCFVFVNTMTWPAIRPNNNNTQIKQKT